MYLLNVTEKLLLLLPGENLTIVYGVIQKQAYTN